MGDLGIFPNLSVMAALLDSEVEEMTDEESEDLAALTRVKDFMESPFYKVDFEPLMTSLYQSSLQGLRVTTGGADLIKNQNLLDICLTFKAYFDGKIQKAVQVHDKYYRRIEDAERV